MACMPLPQHARLILGANVKRARGERRRSAIAEALGSSRETLAQIERGQRAASLDWLADLAQALGTTVADLLNGVRLIPGKNH